jgi:hypothetical protein
VADGCADRDPGLFAAFLFTAAAAAEGRDAAGFAPRCQIPWARRSASRPGNSGPGRPHPPLHPALPGHSQPAPVRPAAAADRPGATAPEPGPVEQVICRLRIDDPAVLLRAAAIDQAARQLITQAEQTSPQPSSTCAARRPTGQNPAQLAAQDTPHSPAAILASRQRPDPTRPAARPTSRSRPASPRRPSQHPRRKPTP